jgi:hypothetical protein
VGNASGRSIEKKMISASRTRLMYAADEVSARRTARERGETLAPTASSGAPGGTAEPAVEPSGRVV